MALTLEPGPEANAFPPRDPLPALGAWLGVVGSGLEAVATAGAEVAAMGDGSFGESLSSDLEDCYIEGDHRHKHKAKAHANTQDAHKLVNRPVDTNEWSNVPIPDQKIARPDREHEYPHEQDDKREYIECSHPPCFTNTPHTLDLRVRAPIRLGTMAPSFRLSQLELIPVHRMILPRLRTANAAACTTIARIRAAAQPPRTRGRCRSREGGGRGHKSTWDSADTERGAGAVSFGVCREGSR